MYAYGWISDLRLPHQLNRPRDWLLRTGWPTFCTHCDRAATRWHARRCRHYALTLDVNAVVSTLEREGLAMTEWQRQLLESCWDSPDGSWQAFVTTTTGRRSPPAPLALRHAEWPADHPEPGDARAWADANPTGAWAGYEPSTVIWDEAPLLEHVARRGGKLRTCWDHARDFAASTGLPVHVYGRDSTWCVTWCPGIGCYLYEQVRDRAKP